ncbi:non-ribosomal peptide synthetase [Bacillus toyonensis]|uniref:non-ribosomal peptide synthetase n=1 Tax=Bacillus toyonensis TaxID=155322 RepID=UPI000BF26BDC|nr:non-ribosomal peptide synthetase [Bacillus toyonensis]PFY16403.1 non-ribosomal peptide synthetase [Bacillus toyonensis]
MNENGRNIKFQQEFKNNVESHLTNNTIHGLFEEQVEKFPDKIAVVFKDRRLTYRQLNEKANQLARILVKNNVSKDVVVPVVMERSLDMIIGLLAILKSGGVYLPIDIEYPVERIQYMLSDSQANILLTQSHLVEEISFEGNKVVLEDINVSEQPKENLNLASKLTDLAYVIYTSGTTGLPKGAMLEHKGIVNLELLWKNIFGISSQDNIGQFASMSFDASIWEILMTLLNGATLYIITKDIINNFVDFQKYVQQSDITVLTLPPTYALYLEPETIPSLRLLITAGSASSENLVNRWNQSVIYVNAYGPTEASICSTVWIAPSQDSISQLIPIGVPIQNTNIYILNEKKQLVKTGELGELYIGGVGLARGYLNRFKLTEEKFVDSPFVQGEKIYRTGDIASLLPDGNIEFHGRMDHQVKIRGHRIELGEIESLLLKHDQVKEVVVIVRKDCNNDCYLCAYYVIENKMNSINLREYLKQFLPDYMIPSYFILLEKMPLTMNGKIDRKSLPEQQDVYNNNNYLSPRNDIESIMVEIWKEVLGTNKIGIRDNFYELGGDSIKAIQVAAKLNAYHLKLETKNLFENPTIEKVSHCIKRVKSKSNQGLVEGKVSLTPIQHWFFAKRFTDMEQWNQSIMLYNPHGYKEAALRSVFLKILEHHDALRMVYKMENQTVLQVNRGIEDNLFEFQKFNVPEEIDQRNFINNEINKMQRNMDIFQGPLVQVGLFHTALGDHLFLSIHHLVVDGISYRILLEDISSAYLQALNNKNIVLPTKTDSFYEWSTELNKYAYSRELLDEIPYWEEVEKKAKSFLLPEEGVPKQNTQNNKASIYVEISPGHTQQLLKHVHRAYNTEVNDILLTALGLAMRDWLGENQIVLNLEAHGREEILSHVNISRTVGWFTSQCPVILNLDNADNLSQLIKGTKEDLRRIPNKGIGYEILKYLTPKNLNPTLNFSIVPEINFNYLGQFEMDMSSKLFAPSLFSNIKSLGPDGEGNLSKRNELYFKINITSFIEDGKLNLTISYNEQRYKFETMNQLSQNIKSHLISIIEHCVNKEEMEYTPSDFTYKELDNKEVDNVFLLLSESLN